MSITRMKNPGRDRPVECDDAPCPNPDLAGPCHIYRGAKTTAGYGYIYVNRRMTLVHRLVWEQRRGPIPEGMEIDHQCRVRACCNPDHLRVVTRQVNLTENSGSAAAVNKAKTHCPVGHEYDAANTIIRSRGTRVCRKCNKRKCLEYHKKRATLRAAEGQP